MRRFGTHFGQQGVQKIRRIQAARQAAFQGHAGSGQVYRRADDGSGITQGGIAGFAQVFGQCIAAQGNPGGVERALRMQAAQGGQIMADFGAVAGVVGNGCGVGNAAATAKMRHAALPAAFGHGLHQCAGVVAVAAAFEAVKQYQ